MESNQSGKTRGQAAAANMTHSQGNPHNHLNANHLYFNRLRPTPLGLSVSALGEAPNGGIIELQGTYFADLRWYPGADPDCLAPDKFYMALYLLQHFRGLAFKFITSFKSTYCLLRIWKPECCKG